MLSTFSFDQINPGPGASTLNSCCKQAEVFYSFPSVFALANEFLFTPAASKKGKATVVEKLVGQQQTDERQSESNRVLREVQSKVANDSCENRYTMLNCPVFFY